LLSVGGFLRGKGADVSIKDFPGSAGDGRVRMINFATREFGVKDVATKKIVSYFMLNPTQDMYKYWATQLLKFTYPRSGFTAVGVRSSVK
jgi:hypothetical protein